MVLNRILGTIAILTFGLLIYFGHRVPTKDEGYIELKAQFAAVDRLREQAHVTVYGQQVGFVSEIRFLEDTFTPIITIKVKKDTQIPIDSILVLRSEAIFGEKRAEIRPGALWDYMQDGDTFLVTDGGINVEIVLDLLLSLAEQENTLDEQ